MDTHEIRENFLAFFRERGHEEVASSSLIPNDPTLLLTNAGMNQFKPYFLGEQKPPFPRATTVQKCFRTQDIDEVGATARHLTFFEMLGNFSFGDYFKEKACPWAWDLVTEEFGIDPDRLWVAVFETDDEAFAIWTDGVGVRPERVVRRGAEDNFWDMTVAGPCGPCSEIFVDLGDAYGPPAEQGPVQNEERYLEIWNLVFMQNECNATIQPVAELPSKSIDTGAGLERLALVLQQAPSVFETDALGGMVDAAQELTGKEYGEDERADVGLRILGDHGRGLTFLIADGVLPSNEKRGYVLRRIMRRAVRHARQLGRDEPVLPHLIGRCVDIMAPAYPELREKHDFIVEVAAREEERFDATLKQGLNLLEAEMDRATAASATKLPDDVAFRLHDTYGFPIDLTREIASEAGLEVDEREFERFMEEQRSRARAALKRGIEEPAADLLEHLAARGTTEFVGYEHLTTPGAVVALSDGASPVAVAGEGMEVDVVLDRTAFYPEGGGQVADRGVLRGPSGVAEVVDVRRPAPGLIVHRARVTRGELRVDDEATAEVDRDHRTGAQQAHTTTHVLHWALRDRLGQHATQAGSLVEPGRLRFDFHHYEPLGDEGVAEIGEVVQDKVSADDAVTAFETSFDYARSIGALAIFGEKYGDFVRVVEIGDYSKELCGGTHVPHTSQVGVAVITTEGSIGANLRRVEALVGQAGIRFLEGRAAMLREAAELLKTEPDQVTGKLERLLATHKEMERKLAEVERRAAASVADELAASAVDVDGTRLVVARRDVGVDALRSLAQTLRGRLGSAVIVLGASGDGKANLVGAVTKDLVERGISARDLLAPGAALLGGGAGGKPELAISGGPSAERLQEAIDAVASAARAALGR